MDSILLGALFFSELELCPQLVMPTHFKSFELPLLGLVGGETVPTTMVLSVQLASLRNLLHYVAVDHGVDAREPSSQIPRLSRYWMLWGC